MELNTEKSRFDFFIASEKQSRADMDLPVKGIDKALDISIPLATEVISSVWGKDLDGAKDGEDIFDLANSSVVSGKSIRDGLETLPINSKQLLTIVTSLKEFQVSDAKKDIESSTGEKLESLVQKVDDIKAGNSRIEDYENLKGYKLSDLEKAISDGLERFLSSIGVRREGNINTTNIDNGNVTSLSNSIFNSTNPINTNVNNSNIVTRTSNLAVLNDGDNYENVLTNSTSASTNAISNVENDQKEIYTDISNKFNNAVTQMSEYNTSSNEFNQNVNRVSSQSNVSSPFFVNETKGIIEPINIKPGDLSYEGVRNETIGNNNLEKNTTSFAEPLAITPRIDKEVPMLKNYQASSPTKSEIDNSSSVSKNSEVVNTSVNTDQPKSTENTPPLSATSKVEAPTQEGTDMRKVEGLLSQIVTLLKGPILTIDSEINFS